MKSYKIIDHEYDVVVLGAGGSGAAYKVARGSGLGAAGAPYNVDRGTTGNAGAIGAW